MTEVRRRNAQVGAHSDRDPKVQAKSEVLATMAKGQPVALGRDGVGIETSSMIWDGYPDGSFKANFNEGDVVATGGLMVHWCHYVNCGDRNGSKTASDPDDGLRKVLKCRGIIQCTDPTCNIITRTPTKKSARNARLKQSCECGASCTWMQCTVEMETKEWEGGIQVVNSGRHLHGRPHKIHMFPHEKGEFREVVVTHPHIGPYGLMVGVPRLGEPRQSVTKISSVLQNPDRVAKERQKIKKELEVPDGNTFIQAFSQFRNVSHPGLVKNVVMEEVTVISLQSLWMCRQLVKDDFFDQPVNGTVNDAAHGWWKGHNQLLMVTSMFCPEMMMWVPGLISYTDGSTAQHFKHHFYTLFKSVADEAERRGRKVDDTLFIGVRSTNHIPI